MKYRATLKYMGYTHGATQIMYRRTETPMEIGSIVKTDDGFWKVINVTEV